ncbi:MAG: hypothetical protein ACWGSD_19720, partial [Thermodesulfobacteriota bacterium]
LEREVRQLLREVTNEFGWRTRAFATISGPIIYRTMKNEQKRLAKGWTLEPKSFFEKNAAALALEMGNLARLRRSVLPVLPEAAWNFGCTSSSASTG